VVTWQRAEVHAAAVAGDQEDRQVELAEHDLPFSTWSLAKLADFLVAERVVDGISHEGPVTPDSRRGRQLSTDENLEGLEGSAVRREEGPGQIPVYDR
jgi:hypothetical protein